MTSGERNDTPASPRVSVLMPCYNGEAFVEEAIRSILDQTLADFEFIIVDDGSTDGSPLIIDAWRQADRRIRVLTKPNGGIVSALNFGLEACRGQYVARMDADDIALPERLAFQADYLDRSPGCVLVGGSSVDEMPPTANSVRASGGRHAATDLSVFPPRIAVAVHPLVMFRRDVVMGIGGYSADYPHAEDYDLFIRLAAHGTIDNPPEDLLFYRRHDDAVSVRHVDVQEDAAVQAELDALQRAAQPLPPPSVIEAYGRLRKFRRYLVVDIPRARRLAPEIARDMVASNLRDREGNGQWRLRMIMARALVRLYTGR